MEDLYAKEEKGKAKELGDLDIGFYSLRSTVKDFELQAHGSEKLHDLFRFTTSKID